MVVHIVNPVFMFPFVLLALQTLENSLGSLLVESRSKAFFIRFPSNSGYITVHSARPIRRGESVSVLPPHFSVFSGQSVI